MSVVDPPVRVLLIGGEQECASLRGMLSQEKNSSFEVECAKKLQTGLERFSKGGIDVILVDLGLPDSQGLDTLEKVYACAADTPIIIMTAVANEVLAMDALRKGAQEYLVKGEMHPKMLSRVIRYAIERVHAEKHMMAEKVHAENLARELDRVLKELKTTQEEMLRREKAMATGELAAAVAHEIRNPLSIISMSVQYLQSKFDSKDPRREFTEAIVRKVERLDAVTMRLISYGRQREIRLVRRSLNRQLNRALSLIKIQCRSQGVDIVRHYNRKLPLMKFDEEMMDEVFINLLTNAVEAMPKGGRLTLITDYDTEQNEALVRIKDTGRGIDSKNRSWLFKLFFSTKKENGGTGLGLAICRQSVSQHGGTIDVESHTSKANRGTSFIIRLPLKRPHPPMSPSSLQAGLSEKRNKKGKYEFKSNEILVHAAPARH